MMRKLYDQEKISWSSEVAEKSLLELLHHPEKGSAWLIRSKQETVGYFVLTLSYSLEFGGVFALLDELYIGEASRGLGIGGVALRFIEEECRRLGAQALRLEAGTENADALQFYERHGLQREARYLMTKRLA